MSDEKPAKVKLRTRLWLALGEKGKIATIVGMLMGVPCAVWLYARLFFFREVPITEAEKDLIIMIQLFAIGWFMMPSSIKIISKLFTIEVVD